MNFTALDVAQTVRSARNFAKQGQYELSEECYSNAIQQIASIVQLASNTQKKKRWSEVICCFKFRKVLNPFSKLFNRTC